MTWINWTIFTRKWLQRAERSEVILDDGDRFIALWIAFNGWMKGKFGEDKYDGRLIKHVKKLKCFENCFDKLNESNEEFSRNLNKLSTYKVADMRDIDNTEMLISYNGTFVTLIDVIYQVRCNLFHGRKEINENKKDFELVSLSHNILMPLFKEYLQSYEGYD